MEEIITKYVLEGAMKYVPVLWIIGYFLKNHSELSNRWIPWVLLAVAQVLTAWQFGFSEESIVQGVLVTGMAVFVHQLLKQSLEGH